MKKDSTHYNKVSSIALIVFLALVIIQIFWLKKAVQLDTQERVLKLQQLIPDLALEVNALDPSAFHGEEVKTGIKSLNLDTVKLFLDRLLIEKNISSPTYFSFYQDSTAGFFISDNKAFKEELKDSKIRSCMSCILSFSIANGSLEQEAGESEEDYLERITKSSKFQYYSPVNRLTKSSGQTIWISLYQPSNFYASIASLWYLFAIGILLTLILLSLFYYLLRSLSRHKKLRQIKDDFFNNMTHEFKTPLSSIRLASRVLKQSKDPKKNQAYYSLIETESKSLENQIDKLLEFSLVNNEGFEFPKKEFSLNRLISFVQLRLQPLLDERKANLILKINHQNDTMIGDENHILNSFCNLVENSLKYSPEGVVVTISSEDEAGLRIVKVSDSGPGVEKEFQAHIFDRFYRGQKGNQYKTKGFGIGLSYVKNTIEAHGGTIELNPSYTGGCEFIIKI